MTNKKSLYKIAPKVDKNGNKCLVFSPMDGQRGFSVQTNGNICFAHILSSERWKDHQHALLTALRDWVFCFGTQRQKNLMPLR